MNDANPLCTQGKPVDDNSSISPVYSLAVQRDGVWLLSGLESGGINLQSVRVDEGKRITRLQGHASAVSVLNLGYEEKSVLSGSWDKTVIDWDLNIGKEVRKFEGCGGQISALEIRPSSSLPVPEASGEHSEPSRTFTASSESKAELHSTDAGDSEPTSKLEPLFGDSGVNGHIGSPNDSLFGGNDADSLFGDENDVGAPSAGGFISDEDNEFSRAYADDFRDQGDAQSHESRQEQVQSQDKTNIEPENDFNVMNAANPSLGVASNSALDTIDQQKSDPVEAPPASNEVTSSEIATHGVVHDHETSYEGQTNGSLMQTSEDAPQKADSVFLAAAIDGSLRIWDKRQRTPIAKMTPQNVPPWCMNATWSPDGNFIYAGRRNGTVDEYSLHKGLRGVERSFKLPNNSGPVSALRAMPNGRHLIW